MMANGDIVPITSRADAGAETYTYTMIDRVGQAKIINSYAKDFKRIALKGKQVSQNIKSIGDSYGFNFQDVRRARMANTNLETETAMAAREAIDDLKEDLGFDGDANADLKGFNTLVETYGTEVIIPADGTSASKTFASKDGDKIVRDMGSMVTAVIDVTNGKERPDTLLLPIDQYTQIANQRMPGDSNTTVLKFFLDKNPWIKEVVMYHKMAGAGDSSTDRMIVYKKDPSKVQYEMPVPLETLPSEVKPTETAFYLHARLAGIIMKRPLSTGFADGI